MEVLLGTKTMLTWTLFLGKTVELSVLTVRLGMGMGIFHMMRRFYYKNDCAD